jgi:hypothetical protein
MGTVRLSGHSRSRPAHQSHSNAFGEYKYKAIHFESHLEDAISLNQFVSMDPTTPTRLVTRAIVVLPCTGNVAIKMSSRAKRPVTQDEVAKFRGRASRAAVMLHLF